MLGNFRQWWGTLAGFQFDMKTFMNYVVEMVKTVCIEMKYVDKTSGKYVEPRYAEMLLTDKRELNV